jgi:hypothetical protein
MDASHLLLPHPETGNEAGGMLLLAVETSSDCTTPALTPHTTNSMLCCMGS